MERDERGGCGEKRLPKPTGTGCCCSSSDGKLRFLQLCGKGGKKRHFKLLKIKVPRASSSAGTIEVPELQGTEPGSLWGWRCHLVPNTRAPAVPAE